MKKSDRERWSGWRGSYMSQVGDERLTLQQIADRAGCAKSTAYKYIQQRGERPEHFIKRMRNR